MSERLRKVTPTDYARIVEEAGAALREGRIVALPTETVYGLGANREDEKALARLKLLKVRSENKPFTLHLADPADAQRLIPRMEPLAARLIDRYWPGPLTVILPGREGGSLGLRVPGMELTRDIIRASRVPVLLPSANPAGLPPSCTAEEVEAYFPEGVDLIVDAGRSQIGDPSTVVKVENGVLEIVIPKHERVQPRKIQVRVQ